MTTTARLSTALTAALAAGLFASAVIPAAAHASGGGTRVERTGSCSGSTDWKLKAKPDDSRIEVEGEIDSNKNGQVWAWTIKHNGSVSAKGTATTKGPSGSFSVNRRMVDLGGADTFVLRAVNQKSGEVCRGTVTL